MNIFNLEQVRLNHIKNKLCKCSDELLIEISNQNIRTSFGFDSNRKLEQRAAYQLIRERRIGMYRNEEK